ncbi:AI-2E family transporter [candidate division KSB1 bacterium]|nr:AI-2E family transporter [candidate division KSB1 bacterium]
MTESQPQLIARPADPQQRRFVLLLLGLLLVAFTFTISDLIPGVIAGMILWVFTVPIFHWWKRRTRNRDQLAAGLSILTTIAFIIVPLTAIGLIMLSDAAMLADRAQAWFEPHRAEFEARLNEITASGRLYIFDYPIEVGDLSARFDEFATWMGQALIGLVQSTAGGLARFAVLLFVTLYTLFFCYLDAARFGEWVRRVLPLTENQSRRLIANFFDTSKATLKAVGIIGVVQGTMGGIAFWICGIPAPFFWTVLMAVASVIPAVGAQIILLPAAILLMLIGKFWLGLGLFLWSWIAIANIDNLLRPVLVKREINLHELLVFLSTIGGIATFGFFGFVIGPVVAALLKSTLAIYAEIYGDQPAESA